MTLVNKYVIALFVAFASISTVWAAKPFKKVLVINGGGINPGIAVGIIAGVQAQGWNPDLVIATCGAGIGAIMNHSESSLEGNMNLLKSKAFFETLNSVQVQTPNAFEMFNKIEEAKDTTRYPHIFENVLLHAPESFPKIINNVDFNNNSKKTKLIILSGRALFGPQDAGNERRRNEPLFQQVYITDPQTAKLIDGWRLPPQFSFPNSTVEQKTATISNLDTISAMRAGIADPYLLNPSIIDDHYHFTGAIDLYPIDLATYLGEEVVTTYPTALFLEHEDRVINMAFGFKQTSKALEAIQHKDVKWIDLSGMDELGFNPKVKFLSIVSTIPSEYNAFSNGVSAQWKLGYDRAVEALKAAPGALVDVRTHLRKPINPKLRDEFSCKNANEWKTDKRNNCTSDLTPNCERNMANTCEPIR